MRALRQQLGRAVRRLRAAKGYSQESFADAVGVHRTYMGSVERGETNISLDNLVRIATGLGLRPSMLLSEAEDEAAGSQKASPVARRPAPTARRDMRQTRGRGGR